MPPHVRPRICLKIVTEDVVFNPLMVQLFVDDAFCNAMESFRPWVIGLTLKRIEDIGPDFRGLAVCLAGRKECGKGGGKCVN